MTTIASLLFTGIFALSISVMMLALAGATPRIRKILAQVHGGSVLNKTRRITVRVPVSLTADIVPLPSRTKHSHPAAICPEKIAA